MVRRFTLEGARVLLLEKARTFCLGRAKAIARFCIPASMRRPAAWSCNA
ncbi:hypothetical protein NHF39_22485 [Pseudomonas proteolytica]|nr:hypothetical protein [Pseudomonas proteolytica]USW97774.1 hypothetical protein NHF39_22485 [Pseudomonas proteolytica]USX02955.1 hypothetical protein NHF41_09055 [Pseudomonas proteolytica]